MLSRKLCPFLPFSNCAVTSSFLPGLAAGFPAVKANYLAGGSSHRSHVTGNGRGGWITAYDEVTAASSERVTKIFFMDIFSEGLCWLIELNNFSVLLRGSHGSLAHLAFTVNNTIRCFNTLIKYRLFNSNFFRTQYFTIKRHVGFGQTL